MALYSERGRSVDSGAPSFFIVFGSKKILCYLSFLKRGVFAMSKIITFTDNDEALIAKIKEYQKAHGLSSFVAAVRKLCSDALEIAKIQH